MVAIQDHGKTRTADHALIRCLHGLSPEMERSLKQSRAAILRTETRSKPILFWNRGRPAHPQRGHAAWRNWPCKLHTEPGAGNRANPAARPNERARRVLLDDVSKDPKETTDLAARELERVNNWPLSSMRGSCPLRNVHVVRTTLQVPSNITQ